MVFFTLLLVLASGFIAGCSSGPSLPFSGTSTPAPTETPILTNAGLTGHQNPVTFQQYTFEGTLAGLTSRDTPITKEDTVENMSKDMHIKTIHGINLDENADAGSWTYIFEHGNKIFTVTFGGQGTITNSITGTIDSADIATDQIVSPSDLFTTNHAMIFSTPGSVDLSLSDGYYTVTITGNSTPRILIFDAKTGGLISSND
jgi:hypothetical protein